jgi:hypothetical protein
MRKPPTIIVPECHASDCHHDGDQYTMVKCRNCDQWYCTDHIVMQEGAHQIKSVDPALHGVTYYLGLCLGCLGSERQQRPVNTTWIL